MAFNNLLQIAGNLLAPEDPSLLRPETTLHVLPASGVSLSVTYGSLTGSVTTATALAHLQTETTSCESVNEVGFLRGILGICVFSFFCWFGGPMGSLEIFCFWRFGRVQLVVFVSQRRGYVTFIRYNYEQGSANQMVNVQQRRWCFDPSSMRRAEGGYIGKKILRNSMFF